MPRYLLDRRQPDSIREFRAAAGERFTDGLSSAKEGRRTAAVYLCGYAAELTLKAAYFAVLGFDATRPISMGDLQAARNAGLMNYQIVWPNHGKFHNVRAWADLQVEHRSRNPGRSYARPGFSDEVRLRGRRIEPLWSETLRYYRNVAYSHEVDRVIKAAGWLMAKSIEL